MPLLKHLIHAQGITQAHAPDLPWGHKAAVTLTLNPEGSSAAARLGAQAAQVSHQLREQLAHEPRDVALQRRRRQRRARAAQPAPQVAQHRVRQPVCMCTRAVRRRIAMGSPTTACAGMLVEL